MGIFGGKSAGLSLRLDEGGPDAEAVLAFLRSGDVLAIMTESGWQPAERAISMNVLQGVREYIYPVVDMPGATIRYRAVNVKRVRALVEVTLRGTRENLESGAHALAGAARLIENKYGVSPRLKGIR